MTLQSLPRKHIFPMSLINRNIMQQYILEDVVSSIRKKNPHDFIIRRIMQEASLDDLLSLVLQTDLCFHELVEAYRISEIRRDRFDLFFGEILGYEI